MKADDEQLRQLLRENLRLREERDILKKAVAIFDYIEGFYNTWRLHSGLGYRTPAEVERLTVC